MLKLLPIISEISRTTQPLLVGGKFCDYPGSEKLTIHYPGDNATIVGECKLLPQSHIPFVEDAADQGFREYRQTSPEHRADLLRKLGDLLEDNRDSLAHLITMESGKPLTLARAEVKRSIRLCRDYASECSRALSHSLVTEGQQARVGLFPLGPVLAITPFNFPLNLAVHKLAPAMAAGCSIVVKPDLRTPLTALYLGRLAVEAGYQAISVIPCNNAVAEMLVQSDVFAKLSFTGSAKVGWHLRAVAGKKSVTLELGGNAAVIVDELTAPADKIAERVAFGAFAFAGQICISVQRIFISRAIYDEFMPALVKAVRALKVGDPLKEDTVVGPMITSDDVQRTRNLIKDAIFAGANVVYGGNTYNALTLNPTLMDRTTPEMTVNWEEAFAPIATVTVYDEFEEALALVNNSKYGLQTGLYTSDWKKAELAYRTLDVGGVIVGDIPTFRSDVLPYGGVKDSGMGREGVLSGIREMSYEKTLLFRAD